ncbi:hypothetical protein EQG49_00470 [Periweissella cryptocerci]|uniref:Uncharacterized protein n=1 Tax=Periweissella cryptocerci TaxID=2506420 RepID=A0A4P6YQZ0_9LACO|nr:hypothetical protein [Periweissella cryptocerci]QBO35028.1 hypothetical protein EQG49_00470 [Periweissella cryptocerci]
MKKFIKIIGVIAVLGVLIIATNRITHYVDTVRAPKSPVAVNELRVKQTTDDTLGLRGGSAQFDFHRTNKTGNGISFQLIHLEKGAVIKKYPKFELQPYSNLSETGYVKFAIVNPAGTAPIFVIGQSASNDGGLTTLNQSQKISWAPQSTISDVIDHVKLHSNSNVLVAYWASMNNGRVTSGDTTKSIAQLAKFDSAYALVAKTIRG